MGNRFRLVTCNVHNSFVTIVTLGTFPFVASVPFVTSNSSDKKERFLTHESYDLWDMQEGIHLYSLSAIYAAFISMAKIEKELDEKADISELENHAKEIKE